MKTSLVFFLLFLLLNPANQEVTGDIFQAASEDNLAAVKQLLLENPPLLESKNDLGYTPLQWAAMKASWRVTAYLIDKGADLKVVAPDGGTVLHRIAHYHAPEIMHKAIAAGSLVSVSNRWGRTALHVAARRGCADVAAVLLDNGADINAVTNEGWTPLHVANKSGHSSVCDFLISRGADLERKDQTGNKASEYSFVRPEKIDLTQEKLKEFCGDYSFGGGYWTKVWLENDRLKIEEFSIDELFYTGEDTFYCVQEPWVIKFHRDKKGEVKEISLQFLRRTVKAVKTERAEAE